jgi:phosphate transport system permease protein
MALSMHLFTVTTQVTNAPQALPFAIALVLLGLVVFVNLTAILVRSWLRGRKKW